MNLFELFVKIGVKDEASSNISSITKSLGNGLRTAAKVGTAAVSAASAGIVALTKAAIDNYTEYEQLVGGVDTLFKNSSQKVQEYAANAYKTAGMSANDYMQTVTSFSASLLQSLEGDTEAAADYANQALIDMSDNANKMGTDMSLIQNAYQGFAKANYTMLDNLKLGYGGTQSEMQRLIADAAELSDTVDSQSMSFANVVEAIHVVQTEMGITGTTALEASKTISGSVGSMKAAWTNLVTGVADDNANFDVLINNFVESTSSVFNNLLPRVEIALTGAGRLVENLLPVIVGRIPEIVTNTLPQMVSAGVAVVESLVNGISANQEQLVVSAFQAAETLATGFLNNLPAIVALGLNVIVSLSNGIADSLPELIPTIVDVVLQIVDTITDPSMLGNLLTASLAIILALANGIIDSLPELLEKAPEIIQNLVDALVDNAPALLKAALQLIVTLVEGILSNLPQLVSSGLDIVSAIIEGIVRMLGDLVMTGKDIVDSVKDGFSKKLSDAKTWGKDLIDNFVGGIKEKWTSLKNTISNVAQTVKDYLGFSEPKLGPLSNFHTYAPDMMDLFAQGIRENERKVTDQIEKSFSFGTRPIRIATETLPLGGALGGYGAARDSRAYGDSAPINIVVQSVLDGRVVGESTYKYIKNKERAYGLA